MCHICLVVLLASFVHYMWRHLFKQELSTTFLRQTFILCNLLVYLLTFLIALVHNLGNFYNHFTFNKVLLLLLIFDLFCSRWHITRKYYYILKHNIKWNLFYKIIICHAQQNTILYYVYLITPHPKNGYAYVTL